MLKATFKIGHMRRPFYFFQHK